MGVGSFREDLNLIGVAYDVVGQCAEIAVVHGACRCVPRKICYAGLVVDFEFHVLCRQGFIVAHPLFAARIFTLSCAVFESYGESCQSFFGNCYVGCDFLTRLCRTRSQDIFFLRYGVSHCAVQCAAAVSLCRDFELHAARERAAAKRCRQLFCCRRSVACHHGFRQ